MSSTRNKNTPNDYCLQQDIYGNSLKYNEYKYASTGRAYDNAIPCVGITPSHMPREAFSHNSVEIESSLFGINSTNLVNPQAPIHPQLKQLPEKSFFERLPMYMPEPLVVERNQRPFPTPK